MRQRSYPLYDAVFQNRAILTILYRDEHMIAIDKPAGLLAHRSDIDRHETRFAVQLLRDQIGRLLGKWSPMPASVEFPILKRVGLADPPHTTSGAKYYCLACRRRITAPISPSPAIIMA